MLRLSNIRVTYKIGALGAVGILGLFRPRLMVYATLPWSEPR